MSLSLFISNSPSPTPPPTPSLTEALLSPDELPPPYEEPTEDSMQRFPLKGTSMPTHPADSTGSLANWATLYGVKVGPRRYPFVIHRHVIQKIPLLRERFLETNDSIEATTGLMELPEVDTMAFAVAVDFAYTGSLDDEGIKLRYAQEDSDSEEDEAKSESEGDLIVVNTGGSKKKTSSSSSMLSRTPEHAFSSPLKPQTHSKHQARHTKPTSHNNTKVETDTEDSELQDSEEDEDAIRPTHDNLLTATFELSQSLQYESLANAIINTYIRILSKDPPSAWSLTFLKAKGLGESKLMGLMLRSIAWCIKSQGYEVWGEREVGFMVGWVRKSMENSGEVMKALARWGGDESDPFAKGDGKGGGGLWVDGKERCEWHEHVDTPVCVGGKKRERGGDGGREKKGKGKKVKR